MVAEKVNITEAPRVRLNSSRRTFACRLPKPLFRPIIARSLALIACVAAASTSFAQSTYAPVVLFGGTLKVGEGEWNAPWLGADLHSGGFKESFGVEYRHNAQYGIASRGGSFSMGGISWEGNKAKSYGKVKLRCYHPGGYWDFGWPRMEYESRLYVGVRADALARGGTLDILVEMSEEEVTQYGCGVTARSYWDGNRFFTAPLFNFSQKVTIGIGKSAFQDPIYPGGTSGPFMVNGTPYYSLWIPHGWFNDHLPEGVKLEVNGFAPDKPGFYGATFNKRAEITAKVNPRPISLSGRVSIPERFMSGEEEIWVDFRGPGGTLYTTGILGTDGTFTVRPDDLMPGTYEVGYKTATTLRVRVGQVTIGSQPLTGTLPFATLALGDIDGDNYISILDYIELSNAFDSVAGDPNSNGNADLDADGTVSILDYIILSSNYDLEGDN
jgi:hypothetical protein